MTYGYCTYHEIECDYKGGCIDCPHNTVKDTEWFRQDEERSESNHKRTVDADELLKRIAEKCKIPSLSEDTVNGLCGATAIIYDMLIESGQEKDADKESD